MVSVVSNSLLGRWRYKLRSGCHHKRSKDRLTDVAHGVLWHVPLIETACRAASLKALRVHRHAAPGCSLRMVLSLKAHTNPGSLHFRYIGKAPPKHPQL